MPNADITVRVLLRPDKGARQPWPCPPGVKIELKRKGRGATAAQSRQATTDTDAVARFADVAEGVHQVRITGLPGQTWWELADELEVINDAEELLEIELVPKDDRRLLVARLITEDGEHITGGTMTVASAGDDSFNETFSPCSDRTIYAVAPKGPVTLTFTSVEVNGRWYCPQASVVPHTVSAVAEVRPLEFIYCPQVTISAKPTITTGAGPDPETLFGTSMTVEYQPPGPSSGTSVFTKTLNQGDSDPDTSQGTISFAFPFRGRYRATVKPPSMWTNNLPIQPTLLEQGKELSAGGSWEVPASFSVVPAQSLTLVVQLPPNQQLAGNVTFNVAYSAGSVPVTVHSNSNQGSAEVPTDGTWTISLAPGAATAAGNLPLQMSTPNQSVTPGTKSVVVVLEYEYSITVHAVDEHGQPVQGAVLAVFDQNQTPIGTVVTDAQGSSVIGVQTDGPYYLAEHSIAGEAMRLTPVTVHSHPQVEFKMLRRGGGSPSGGEALTDLSAYPVLTEEISTTGVPTPIAGGGPGGGGPGAGYGQTVDQVLRDVLGWRPSGDVAGFQAALGGAFSLREVEGHTEWTWQQRGYAVQADMGALTGAQASIYARAKSALDQILPLLAGLTTINPALYPPQDLEAIRAVVTAELNELVSELAWEGGPRIQRVDELFRLLLGESRRSFSFDPDRVEGQLGILRDRFGLTVDQIDTVDEERIVTNFRVIVEQVLALQASWFKDRELLSGVNARTSLGTILIWLSRGLEAVCESVGDLTFALDSVYVDAAQRQVIELRFAGLTVEVPELPLRKATTKTMPYTFGSHEPPILLSDLLDWVTRASRDEGPRIVQDAGKDGVQAFEPVLDKLRILIHATRKAVHNGSTLPAGMRTPRVSRALQVLAAQLDEAANFARLVRREPIPQIATALASLPDVTPIAITLTGANFRKSDSAVLIAENREDLPNLPGSLDFSSPSAATATFPVNPATLRNTAGTTWLVALVNENGTQSNQVEAVRVAH
jgi:hypothetical protein